MEVSIVYIEGPAFQTNMESRPLLELIWRSMAVLHSNAFVPDDDVPPTPFEVACVRGYEAPWFSHVAAFCGDLMVGQMGLCEVWTDAHGFLMPRTFRVFSEWRGKGIGSAMLKRAEETYRERGLSGVGSYTTHRKAIPFYKRHGYIIRPDPRCVDYYAIAKTHLGDCVRDRILADLLSWPVEHREWPYGCHLRRTTRKA